MPLLKEIKREFKMKNDKENKNVYEKQDWLMIKLMIEVHEIYARDFQSLKQKNLSKFILPLKYTIISSMNDQQYS